MTATCTVQTLRTVLRAALAATDRESFTGGAQVHLHAGDGRICATATDRYVVSHARLAADGQLAPVLIHREDATLILRLLDDTSPNQATIGRVGSRPDSPLYVRCGDRRLVFDVGRLSTWPSSAIANLTKILPDRTGPGHSPVAVNPHHLERLVAAIRPRAAGALRIYTGPHPQPVRLEIGDWWLGVIMPVSDRHLTGTWADMPHVPLTLGGPS
jgi:hypothetical protein